MQEALRRISTKLGFNVEEALAEAESEAESEAEVEPEVESEAESEAEAAALSEAEAENSNDTITKRESDDTRAKRETADLEMLAFDDMLLMYDMCRFEKSWNPSQVSVWCAAFTTEDLKVMEYYQELEYWYKNGYFYTINTEFACPLMKDMAAVFEGFVHIPYDFMKVS